MWLEQNISYESTLSLETLPGRLPDKQPLVGEQQRLGPKHLNESGPCCKWIGPQVGHCNRKKDNLFEKVPKNCHGG